MNLIQTLEQEEIARLGKTIPDFMPGDTVIVSVNVVEGTRKRLQAYEGVAPPRGRHENATRAWPLHELLRFAQTQCACG